MSMESDRCCQASVSNVDSMGSLGLGPSHADGRTMKLSGYQHGHTRVGACREIEESGQILSLNKTEKDSFLLQLQCSSKTVLLVPCCYHQQGSSCRQGFQ